VGDGFRSTVVEILSSLGEGQIMVTPGRTTGLGGQRRAGRPVRIRYEDMPEVKAAVPALAGIAPFFDLRGGGAASWRYSIPYSPARAVSHEYYEVRRLPVCEGRWFTAQEEKESQWVAVLNEGLRRIIFPGVQAVGQWIEWRDRRMTVVGVVRDEALFPYIFFVPYKTASQMADTRYVSGLIARPGPGVSWTSAVSQLRRTLAALGQFNPLDDNALEIEDNRDFTTRVEAMTTALHILVITIAAVSLLLGGLGVANMMVIAVTERIREFGLRKAIGATPGDIFLQVFFEAALIVAAGGFVGVLSGALACIAMGPLALSDRYVVLVAFNFRAALAAFSSLGVVAFVAGTIPARKAAALPAAEALRWE
jgi:putative ABC transport system permease protein